MQRNYLVIFLNDIFLTTYRLFAIYINQKIMSISIKILGTGCPKCKQTTALVQEVVNENNIAATIEKVEDIMEIINYEVMSTPAIVVNEEVKIKGRVPSKEEILDILTGNEKTKNEKEADDCCSGTSCC